MFLSQARTTRGLHLAAVADLSPDRARAALATGLAAGAARRAILCGRRIERHDVRHRRRARGDRRCGDRDRHRRDRQSRRRHRSRARVLQQRQARGDGQRRSRRARRSAAREARADAGIVYSLAYGDQPALICEMVDWARAAGFDVVAAGKGTKYLPAYHASTPDTVWRHYGLTPEDARAGGLNPQMFNSFLDGTKSAIEMAAVANATGLRPHRTGSRSRRAVSTTCRAYCVRATQAASSTTAARSRSCRASSATAARSFAICAGVYTSPSRAGSDYVERCFREYGLLTDDTGEYTAMYKPYHLIGLELGISVASVGLRREPTGVPQCVERRRRRNGKTRPARRRDARRRRWFHRLRQADAGRGLGGARWVAAWACASA